MTSVAVNGAAAQRSPRQRLADLRQAARHDLDASRHQGASGSIEAAKAGHAGTLDPLATGVLPLALGEATKTVPFVVEGSKQYRFTVRFGAETDTDDADGKVVASSETRPSSAAIEAELPSFTGEIEQVPPRYLGAQGRRGARLRACPR